MNAFPLAIVFVLAVTGATFTRARAQTASGPARTWVDNQGRTTSALLVDVKGDQVVLRMAGGNASTTFEKLSAPDQTFVREWCRQNGRPDPSIAAGPSAWPDKVVVTAADMPVKTISEDIKARQCVYQSGVFQFTTQMKLAPSVLKEVARDFEEVRLLISRMPWGWQPKPPAGQSFFEARIFETVKDYNLAGGQEATGGSTQNHVILTYAERIGLKKVGQGLAKDPASRNSNILVALVAREAIGDMNAYLQPWVSMGIEMFLEHLIFRGSVISMAQPPERALKEYLKNQLKYTTQFTPQITDIANYVRKPWSELRNDGPEIRSKNQFNSLLLFYYFAYLDGDGKGTRLNQYFRAVAQEATKWRAYSDARKSGGSAVPYPGPQQPIEELRKAFMEILIEGRTDNELSAEIVAKFKANGIKVN